MDNIGFIEEEPEMLPLENSQPVATLVIGNVWAETAHYDFVAETKRRINGVTKESFADEVQAWSEGFKLLPVYNRESYKTEIASMKMEFQSDNNFSFEKLAILYSTQVAYRDRLTTMKSIVNAHHEIYNQAYKSLDKQAFKLFSKAGGLLDDKKADSAHVVAPFLRLVSQAKEMLDQIVEKIESIEFSAFQLSRMLREKEALTKINSSYDREGQHAKWNSETTSHIRHPRQKDSDGFEEL
jgi:iron-sulfur cluster repair protein YtfE (RIC family)